MIRVPAELAPRLYPPRERETNIALIRGVRGAPDQRVFEEADREVGRSLHPSLLSELDWMEQSVPPAQREGAAGFVDGLFHHHLPGFMGLRREAFETLDEDALAAEVAAYRDFYRYLAEEAPAALAALGPELGARVRRHLGADAPRAAERARAEAEARAAAWAGTVLDDVVVREGLVLRVESGIRNLVAGLLDHPPARLRAKRLLRSMGGVGPRLEVETVRSRDDLDPLVRRLKEIADAAHELGLPLLEAFCRALSRGCEALDLDALGPSAGQVAAGYGPCARCSMMFSSTATVSLDPTHPNVIDEESGRVYLPLDLNLSICPFCGERARVEAPAIFYHPDRNQVIHNAPRGGGMSEAEALEVHRPMLEALREKYKSRVDADEAAAFDAAGVEITHSTADFLVAIQMGTTAREVHVYNVVELPDGSGLLVDPTKGVIIELTAAELARHADFERPPAAHAGMDEAAPGGRGPEARDAGAAGDAGDAGAADTGLADGATPGSVSEARAAFAAHDYARAREILQALHERWPEDDVVRKNLAVVLLSSGEREAARRVLAG